MNNTEKEARAWESYFDSYRDSLAGPKQKKPITKPQQIITEIDPNKEQERMEQQNIGNKTNPAQIITDEIGVTLGKIKDENVEHVEFKPEPIGSNDIDVLNDSIISNDLSAESDILTQSHKLIAQELEERPFNEVSFIYNGNVTPPTSKDIETSVKKKAGRPKKTT